MINVSQEVKDAYKNSMYPHPLSAVQKTMRITFSKDSERIVVPIEKIHHGSFTLTESLCSEENLVFGSCESSQVEVTIQIDKDLTGYKMAVVHELLNQVVPLGIYTVTSCKRASNKGYRKIVALDDMEKFNVNVSDWWNTLKFPITVKAIRTSLFKQVGVTFMEQDLPNDSFVIKSKTIEGSEIIARKLLFYIGEMNGQFAHIGRDGIGKFISLSALGLYPREDLYPSDTTLYPSEFTESLTSEGSYRSVEYEDYTVEAITGILIRQDDGDIGVTIGDSANRYTVTGNALLFGASATELETVINNMMIYIANKNYRPHNTVMNGLPYLEVGDSVSIFTSDDVIQSFFFKRVLTGIENFTDTVSATGTPKLKQEETTDSKIEQLRQQGMRIQANVDGLEIEVFGDDGLISKVELNSSKILQEVTRATEAEGALSSQIELVEGEVNLRVTQGDMASYVSVRLDSLVLSSDKIILNGYTSINGNFQIDENGNLKFVGADAIGMFHTNGYFRIDSSSGSIAMNPTALSISNGKDTGLSYNIAQGMIIFNNSGTTSVTPTGISTGSVSASSLSATNITENGSSLSSKYASSSHYQPSTTINPITTGGGNVGLNGLNVASVNWCNSTFEPKTSSDVNLKYEIENVSKALEIIRGLKPKQYRFKDSTENQKKNYGVIAQQLESLLASLGIDSSDTNLVEEYEPRFYKDEGMYTKNPKRVNYVQLLVLLIPFVQYLDEELALTKDNAKILENKLAEYDKKHDMLVAEIQEMKERLQSGKTL